MLLTLSALAKPRWTADQANQWYAEQAWPVGCNFIPSSAINQLEMWQASSFDPPTIDRELGYAESLGMNTVRVFLHNLPWEEDSQGFLGRMNQFLELADKHHIKTVFVLFDSCWNDEPKLGTQAQPKAGVHNSGWLRAPGTKRLFDSRTWGPLQGYVQGVIGALRDDRRVLAWDLYNEPSNSGYKDAVMPLLRATFDWAQETNPSQPLTAGVWEDHPMSNEFMLENSDIISFHNYEPGQKLEQQILSLKQLGRPLLCTEYMARTRQSTFQNCLPILKKYRVGAYNWGLVSGKTNTIFEWDKPIPQTPEPTVWFHDIFRRDGSPFNQGEVDFIRSLLK
jgi:hypothetical protein